MFRITAILSAALLLCVQPAAQALELPTQYQSIAVNQATPLTLAEGERVWLHVKLDEEQRGLGRLTPSTSLPLSVKAYDVDGNQIGGDTFRITTSEIFLHVGHRFNSSGTTEVRFERFADVDFFEPNDTVAEATELLPGLPIRAQLFPQGDRDIYAVNVEVAGFLTPILEWEAGKNESISWQRLDENGEILERTTNSFHVQPGRHWLKPVYRFNGLSYDSHVLRIDFTPMATPEQREVSPGDVIVWQPAMDNPRTYTLRATQSGWLYMETLQQPFRSDIRIDGENYKGPVWVEPGELTLSFKGSFNKRSATIASHRVHLAASSFYAPAQSQEVQPLDSTAELVVGRGHPATVRVRADGTPWYARLTNMRTPFQRGEVKLDKLSIEVAELPGAEFRPLGQNEKLTHPGEYAVRVSLATPVKSQALAFVDLQLHKIVANPPLADSAISISVIDLSSDQNAALQDMALSAGAHFIAVAEAGSIAKAVEQTVQAAAAAESKPWMRTIIGLVIIALMVALGVWLLRRRLSR